MTIDEAILHAREKAAYNNEKAKQFETVDNKNMCFECAKEHEQLAEWLEELKDYRDKNKIIMRIDVENMQSVKDRTIELAKEQYNKAIDDCLEVIERLRGGKMNES